MHSDQDRSSVFSSTHWARLWHSLDRGHTLSPTSSRWGSSSGSWLARAGGPSVSRPRWTSARARPRRGAAAWPRCSACPAPWRRWWRWWVTWGPAVPSSHCSPCSPSGDRLLLCLWNKQKLNDGRHFCCHDSVARVKVKTGSKMLLCFCVDKTHQKIFQAKENINQISKCLRCQVPTQRQNILMLCFVFSVRVKMFHSTEVSEVKYTLLCCVLILEWILQFYVFC